MKHPEGAVTPDIVRHLYACIGDLEGAAAVDARMARREPALHALALRETEALLRLARRRGVPAEALGMVTLIARLVSARLYEGLELGHARLWEE